MTIGTKVVIAASAAWLLAFVSGFLSGRFLFLPDPHDTDEDGVPNWFEETLVDTTHTREVEVTFRIIQVDSNGRFIRYVDSLGALTPVGDTVAASLGRVNGPMDQDGSSRKESQLR